MVVCVCNHASPPGMGVQVGYLGMGSFLDVQPPVWPWVPELLVNSLGCVPDHGSGMLETGVVGVVFSYCQRGVGTGWTHSAAKDSHGVGSDVGVCN